MMLAPKVPLALTICTVGGTALAKEAAGVTVPEYCGKASNAAFRYDFMHWDCADIAPKSIAALEATVKETHSMSDSAPKDSDLKVYESSQPHFSAWIFSSGNKAVRYRSLYEGDSYKGIGATTYCSDSPDSCARFEAFSASAIPGPLVFQLGPPPPVMPPIEH